MFGERHLRHVLSCYIDYYNSVRTHLSLGKDTPIHRAVEIVGVHPSATCSRRPAPPVRADLICDRDRPVPVNSEGYREILGICEGANILPAGSLKGYPLGPEKRLGQMGAPRVPSARVIFQLTFCPIVTDVVGARATHRVFSRLVMHLQTHLRSRKIIRALAKASAAMVISAALLVPATAQFWNPFSFGGPPRQRAPQQQQQYNPFGNFFDPGLQQRRQRRDTGYPGGPTRRPDASPQDSQAPPPPRRSAESAAKITSPILVLGDAMAEWLAYGLEDAFSERPEFGIVRRHRTYAGLVRYDPRREVEWPQIVREAIAADKPKFIVMMVGFYDRQSIRERGPETPSRGPSQTPPQDDPESQGVDSPESRARASAAAQNAAMERAKSAAPAAAAEQKRAPAAPSGPREFQSEAWQEAYVQRIDATIATLKSANVPVFWVGLPPQRGARQSADAVYLNELYRTRAERAGIVYVDVWDGFVDEAGRYMLQGPDFEGQTRRLRSGDGLFFTRAGARKLAHYVEREILRSLLATQTPVALPAPEPAVVQPGTGRASARGPGGSADGLDRRRQRTPWRRPDVNGRKRPDRDPRAGARRAGHRAGRACRQFRLAAQRRRHDPRGRAGSAGAVGTRARATTCPDATSADIEAGLVIRSSQNRLASLSGTRQIVRLRFRQSAARSSVTTRFLSDKRN